MQEPENQEKTVVGNEWILSIHSGPHDSSAALYRGYGMLSAIHQERMTRVKTDGGFPDVAIDEVLRIAGIARADVDQLVMSRGSYPVKYMKFSAVQQLRFALHRKKGKERHKNIASQQISRNESNPLKIWDQEKFCREEGFRENLPVTFVNHHFAHALAAFFYGGQEWQSATLIYTADGGGDGVFTSARIFKDGKLSCLFGDDRHFYNQKMVNSLALAYGYCTRICGFRMNRHEGKLTGLAAYGEPELAEKMASYFWVADNGEIGCRFRSNFHMESVLKRICAGSSREVVAASIQEMIEVKTREAITKIVENHGIKNLAVAGGLFANVRLNALLAKIPGIEEIFIFPAMGDDGLSAGGALAYLLERDGLATWLGHRKRLDDVFLGATYEAADSVFQSDERLVVEKGDLAEKVAARLANGRVGAIFARRMEYGPRALGARTILANPSNADVNQTINDRLNRSEFMPFAPFVREEDAEEVFLVDDRTRYACRFMTITTGVRPEWREKIPAVVHVDQTARPQIIRRSENALYYDILTAFREKTGLPVLVNTSFNAHEEPIINRPEEALKALIDDRVDFLVTDEAIYEVKSLS